MRYTSKSIFGKCFIPTMQFVEKQHNSTLKALILWYLTFRVKRDTPRVIWHHVWFVPMHPSFLIPSGWYDLLHFLMTSNEINFVFQSITRNNGDVILSYIYCRMFGLRHISQYIYSMHIVLHPFVSTCYLIGCQHIMLTNNGG